MRPAHRRWHYGVPELSGANGPDIHTWAPAPNVTEEQ